MDRTCDWIILTKDRWRFILLPLFLWEMRKFWEYFFVVRNEEVLRIFFVCWEMKFWEYYFWAKWGSSENIILERNEEVLRRVGHERTLLKAIWKQKIKRLGHILYRDCLSQQRWEESDGGKKRKRGRGRIFFRYYEW